MINKITDYLNDIGEDGLCLAFSGGVDSTVLLKLATLSNINVIAVTFDTYLHPVRDIESSMAIAKEFGVEHYVIKINELENHNIFNNPPNRCYHCKHLLFSKLKDFALLKGYKTLIDGTNFDDLHEYRPGLQALKELEVLSPFALLEIKKETVRQIARELKLDVSEKPSSPCLATRIPYNTMIKPAQLKQIESAEEYLKTLGFNNIRVRYHGDTARIEIDTKDIIKAAKQAREISVKLKEIGFVYVTLDLEGFRSGSMDIGITK